MNWQPTIGLEMHVQLKTASKLFSDAAVDFGADANSCVSVVDLAIPGTLPVLNDQAVVMAIKFALVAHAKVADQCSFARKNYSYPDLPRGYQTSQYDQPLVIGGYLDWHDENNESHRVNLVRAHLEEDAGKLLHDRFINETAVDLNRAGTALLEVVTEPEITSASEAVGCLKRLHDLVCALDICDGDMSQGSLRCDVNVSLAAKGAKKLGTRTEMKNLNSFKFIHKAIIGEIERQRALLEKGDRVKQQTRHYDAKNDTSYAMRDKEEEMDYRYFPDPDLLPLKVTAEEIAVIKKTLAELPEQRLKRLCETYDLDVADVALINQDAKVCAYLDEAARTCTNIKLLINWINGDLSAYLNRSQLSIDRSPVSAKTLATLVNRIAEGIISGKIAKIVFAELCKQTNANVDETIERLGMKQQSDTAILGTWVSEVLAENTQQHRQYQEGDEAKRKRLLGFFVGQVMKRSKGQASPKELNNILIKHLLD